jgi:hypothetical protein
MIRAMPKIIENHPDVVYIILGETHPHVKEIDGDLNIPIYDFETGGCNDGLRPHEVNANQGAESTLVWLISLLTMYEIMGKKDIKRLENKDDTLT